MAPENVGQNWRKTDPMLFLRKFNGYVDEKLLNTKIKPLI